MGRDIIGNGGQSYNLLSRENKLANNNPLSKVKEFNERPLIVPPNHRDMSKTEKAGDKLAGYHVEWTE